MQIFLISVHFGDQSTTHQIIRSLSTGNVQPNKIVLIDNDPETLKLPAELDTSKINIIRPATNNGYGAGINTGLGWLTVSGANPDDIIIATNNDTTWPADAIQKLRTWWQKENPQGLVSPHIQENEKIITGGIIKLPRGTANMLTKNKFGGSEASVFVQKYLHGACIIASYKTWLKLRGFPEDYFLYGEDVTLSLRATKKKLPLQIAPFVIRHREHKTSKQQQYYLVRNGARWLEQETPGLWPYYWKIANKLRFIYHYLLGKKRVAKALSDAAGGATGVPQDEHRLEGAGTTEPASTAIIVTHNNEKTIQSCLQSLEDENIKHIVIVDNNSSDLTLKKINATLSNEREGLGVRIKVIKNKTNLGFASACNQGASHAKTELILLLNPDAFLNPDALKLAQNHFAQNPKTGIIGLNLNEPMSFGPKVTPLTLFTRKIHTKSKVDWVSAGAMLIRTKLFQELEGFDENFFMYWEDVDICKRATEIGWKIVHLKNAKVKHLRGVSSSNQSKKTRLYDASADKYFCKHYPTVICFFLRILRRIYRIFSPEAL